MSTISEFELGAVDLTLRAPTGAGVDAEPRVRPEAGLPQVKPLRQAPEGIEIHKPDALAHVVFAEPPPTQRTGQMDGH